MKILITGFDPFNNNKINPSEEAIKLLPNKINNVEIIKKIIPTVFNESFEKIKSVIDDTLPDFVVCVGQAYGRDSITIERVAINIDDAPITDNKGNQPIDKKIKTDGENAYFSTLPIKLIIKNLQDKKINATISNSAGTFVCNHIMYQVLHYARAKNLNYLAGFVHIPLIPEQTSEKNVPTMELQKIVFALENILHTLTTNKNKKDIHLTGGKLN